MAQNSKIEWTEATWNPIVGCSIVSPGCTNCYAMKMAARLDAMGQPRYAGLTKPSKAGAVWTGEMKLAEEALTIPLRRKKPTTWFVNSMSDLFHESVPDAWIDRVFAVMALAPQHTFQVLTKRSARMRAYCTSRSHLCGNIGGSAADIMLEHTSTTVGGVKTTHPLKAAEARKPAVDWAYANFPNVWLGVSAEDQRRADERVPDLLATPAAVRFVSAEPLLGPIDFTAISTMRFRGAEVLNALTGELHGMFGDPCGTKLPPLAWIIVGGESGPNARSMAEEWALSIVEQGCTAGVACFVKQLSGPRGRAIKDITAFPVPLQVREMPGSVSSPAAEGERA